MSPQFGMHARAAIAAPAGIVTSADCGRELPVGGSPRALGPAEPVVVAAAADLEHLAHELDQEVGDVAADEAIAHLRAAAWPKMSAARFEMSRSIFTRSSSRRSCMISAAWSAGLGPTRRAGAADDLGIVGTGAPLPGFGRLSAQPSQL